MDDMKTISVLGSTGSIGEQTLDVLSSMKYEYRIAFLTANTKIDYLALQAVKYKPYGIAISDEKSYFEFKKKYNFSGKILCGEEGIIEAASYSENDIVLQALVGFSGVKPTLAAINAGIDIALANKETLVSAGSVVMEAVRKKNVRLLPVDSEHSAIMQCLAGENNKQIEKIILTASGGPFFRLPMFEFAGITKAQALNHPNWTMGDKITIDSATMMNKGFEVIEAYWLFGVSIEQIDVLIHPQSIVHSFVQFVDGSVKAQLGLPDMRIPISHALNHPNRMTTDFPRLDLINMPTLEFFKPDYDKFRCLAIAFEALKIGGNAPAIVNAANEIAVSAFLDEKIKFHQIPDIIEYSLKNISIIHNADTDEIVNTDLETRKKIKEYIFHI